MESWQLQTGGVIMNLPEKCLFLCALPQVHYHLMTIRFSSLSCFQSVAFLYSLRFQKCLGILLTMNEAPCQKPFSKRSTSLLLLLLVVVVVVEVVVVVVVVILRTLTLKLWKVSSKRYEVFYIFFLFNKTFLYQKRRKCVFFIFLLL